MDRRLGAMRLIEAAAAERVEQGVDVRYEDVDRYARPLVLRQAGELQLRIATDQVHDPIVCGGARLLQGEVEDAGVEGERGLQIVAAEERDHLHAGHLISMTGVTGRAVAR